MYNPTRRNRNIGTAKQGFGQNNSFVIPRPLKPFLAFYERLENYSTDYTTINGHEFVFITEETRKDSVHACSIKDISEIIKNIPKTDYGDLRLIILRQPKRKEEIKSSVWGRLIYFYEFENDFYPAVILEAQSSDKKIKWSKKLRIDDQKELERLKEDGHVFHEDKRNYVAEFDLNATRNTQLYRTLIHEFGHYVHYLEVVKRPLSELKSELDSIDSKISDDDTSETNPLYDQWNILDDEYNNKVEELEKVYFSIPTDEKEVFAHNYQEKLQKKLKEKGVIPFDRIM
ncbi:hypothetical protein [Aureivirga sp. CE67]|uniref:hypothetical protein n=1 Tax=Aureivirga sp. CE67 TaxID=1788983 RepID=UPI0018CB4069|nr:hypothetical protein [Aureivirga sp. CE67]